MFDNLEELFGERLELIERTTEYGICIELGFWLGFVMPVEVLEMVFMTGGVIIPLPFMVIRHRKLEKEYKLK